jgi:hypothetical protein
VRFRHSPVRRKAASGNFDGNASCVVTIQITKSKKVLDRVFVSISRFQRHLHISPYAHYSG